MGDNRYHSGDSSFHLCDPADPACDPADAYVDVGLVVGRVVAVIWPRDHIDRLHRPGTFADVPDPGGAPPAEAPTPSPAPPPDEDQ